MKWTSLDPGRCKTNPFLFSGDLVEHGFGNKADSFARYSSILNYVSRRVSLV